MGKVFRYGCGGLVALIVLAVIIGAFTGGDEEVATDSQSGSSGQSEQNQPDSQDQSQSGEQGSGQAVEENQEAAEEDQASGQGEQPVVGIGEPVQVGEVQWTVTGAESTNQLTAEFQEPRQGDFVVVNFTFTNNGTEAKALTSESITLIDSQGRQFEADTDTLLYVDPSESILFEEVNPGVTREGTVIYTVAPDASGFVLEVGDTAVFSSESARRSRFLITV